MDTDGTTNFVSTTATSGGTITWAHPYEIESQVDVSQRLLNVVQALEIAVNAHFMRPEHGANIWKNYLKKSGIDLSERKE